ncbi:MAG: DsrE family protein [Saprospiraceae bacterium]|nr:DsrE family protein [Saprospiraceae bacterium]
MKCTLIIIFLNFLLIQSIQSQETYNPIVQDFGGIFDIPHASVKPDANQEYKIVIDVVSGPKMPHELNPAINNVARLLNLHGIAGVPEQQMDVVLAIHGEATDAVLNNESYESKYDMANPNVLLLAALEKAGVKITVCGQSLIGHRITADQVLGSVEIATSMLTTVSSYQMKGYAFFRF